MIVNFWLSFGACFLLEFWLSLMIMIDSYVDCFLLLITFDDCFWLSFLSMMIVFESYVDCLWWFFLWLFFIVLDDCLWRVKLIVFYWVLIALDDCLWQLCWLLITFDGCFWLSFDYPWWLSLLLLMIFFIYIFWLFILNIYFCEWKIVSFKFFFLYHLTLIHCNKW